MIHFLLFLFFYFDNFYVLGRLGRAVNTNRAVTEKSGNYAGLGLGKSFGNIDAEMIYSSTEIRNNDNAIIRFNNFVFVFMVLYLII